MMRRALPVLVAAAVLLLIAAPAASAATAQTASTGDGVPLPYLLGAAAMGIITASLAYRAGRNPVWWFVVGFLFGLIGLVAFLVAQWRRKRHPIATAQVPRAPTTVTALPARPDLPS